MAVRAPLITPPGTPPQKAVRAPLDPHPHRPWYRQLLNFIGCLLAVPLFRAIGVNTHYPATMDLLVGILLAEACRYNNERRRIAFREGATSLRDKDDVEKLAARLKNGQPQNATCDVVAGVVGYREDPDLWARSLESYKAARGLKFLVVGIDGNAEEDQEMVDVFQKVYPEQTAIVDMEEPLGEVANAVRAREMVVRQKRGDVIDEDEINDIAMRACIEIARYKLTEAVGDLPLSGPDGIKRMLVKQRHLHKKGIMFTLFCFSIVIADVLGIDIMWSSDSDTIVLENSLEDTVSVMAGDPKAGGSSCGLTIHNCDETVVTKLASCIYWCELYLTRSFPGSMAVSDCQSGPSAAFRLSAIRPILIRWYNQKIFGQRMIINEDRHLTTLLLLRGWNVIYAGDTQVQTDTPTTLKQWIRQQTRWSRAQHIESMLPLRVYIVNHPLLFMSALRREIAHLIVFVQCLLYLFADVSLISFNMPDLGLRLVGLAAYNFMRNPDRQSAGAVLWMIPGLLFFNVPLPAIQAWTVFTMTTETWGSSMRSSSEKAKKDDFRKKWFESGFFVFWMAAVGAMLAKWTSFRLDMTHGETLLWEWVAAAACGLWTWKLTIRDT